MDDWKSWLPVGYIEEIFPEDPNIQQRREWSTTLLKLQGSWKEHVKSQLKRLLPEIPCVDKYIKKNESLRKPLSRKQNTRIWHADFHCSSSDKELMKLHKCSSIQISCSDFGKHDESVELVAVLKSSVLTGPFSKAWHTQEHKGWHPDQKKELQTKLLQEQPL